MTQGLIRKLGLWSIALFGALTMLLALPACHTVEGAGQDVQSLGGAVQDTAEDIRPYD